MASEKRPFSHITVNVEEEDDLVIQAGAVDAGAPSSDEAAPSDGGAPDVALSADAARAGDREEACPVHADDDRDADLDSDEGAPASEQAPSSAHADAGDEGDAPARPASAGRAHEGTSLQDLESSKMGGLQKAIVAVAVLAVVGFAVYYIFFR